MQLFFDRAIEKPSNVCSAALQSANVLERYREDRAAPVRQRTHWLRVFRLGLPRFQWHVLSLAHPLAMGTLAASLGFARCERGGMPKPGETTSQTPDKGGDRDATLVWLDAFIRENHRLVTRYVYGFLGPAARDAGEDVCGEVWVVAAEKAGMLHEWPRSRVLSYLYGAARNKIRDYRSEMQRRRELMQLPEDLAVEGEDVARAEADRHLAQVAQQHFGRLTRLQREVAERVLRDSEDYKVVAADLAITRNHLRQLIFTVRRILIAVLQAETRRMEGGS